MTENHRPMIDRNETDRNDLRLIWDLPVRIVHWALVLCVAGSVITHYAGAEWFGWHRRCGYAVLVLTAFRILWGFVGTRHARFADFVRGPRAILAYLRAGPAARVAGHNPLGALSVIALLATLLTQAVTGLFANDEVMNAGPLMGYLSQAWSNRITGWHHLSANVLWGLIALHVSAVLYYVWVRRQPIIRAMITGRRARAELPPSAGIAHSRTRLAAILILLLTGLLALAIRTAPEAAVSLF